MLQCTDAAATILNEARERQGLPETYGLRLRASAHAGSQSGVEISFVPSPAPGDEVTIANGTRLFVAPDLAPKVASLTLDSSPDPEAPGFVLRTTAPN